MIRPNKSKDTRYEYRFLSARKKEGATRAYRHYGAPSIIDVEWTDKEGYKHQAQLKFSSKKPRISQAESEILYDYAQEKKKKEGIHVWLIMKTAYKAEVWKRLN